MPQNEQIWICLMKCLHLETEALISPSFMYVNHVMSSQCKCIQMTFRTKWPSTWESVPPFKAFHQNKCLVKECTSFTPGKESPVPLRAVTWRKGLINAVKYCLWSRNVYLCVSVYNYVYTSTNEKSFALLNSLAKIEKICITFWNVLTVNIIECSWKTQPKCS